MKISKTRRSETTAHDFLSNDSRSLTNKLNLLNDFLTDFPLLPRWDIVIFVRTVLALAIHFTLSNLCGKNDTQVSKNEAIEKRHKRIKQNCILNEKKSVHRYTLSTRGRKKSSEDEIEKPFFLEHAYTKVHKHETLNRTTKSYPHCVLDAQNDEREC